MLDRVVHGCWCFRSSEFYVDTFRWDLQLAALGNLDCLDGLVARLGLDILNLLNNIVTLEDLAKDDVSVIEPSALPSQ